MKQDFYDVTELDDGDITFEDAQTSMGTPLLIARAAGGACASVYTIYMSHEIEVIVTPGAEQTSGVTDEDVATIVNFLTDAEFTPLTAAK